MTGGRNLRTALTSTAGDGLKGAGIGDLVDWHDRTWRPPKSGTSSEIVRCTRSTASKAPPGFVAARTWPKDVAQHRELRVPWQHANATSLKRRTKCGRPSLGRRCLLSFLSPPA